MKKTVFYLAFLLLSLTAACGTSSNEKAAEAAEAYLLALARQNKEEVINLSCKSWEEQAALEVDALLSVGSEVNDLTCEEIGQEESLTLVRCQGSLDLTYNEEIRSLDLSRRTYYMAQEEGRWRVCSYQ